MTRRSTRKSIFATINPLMSQEQEDAQQSIVESKKIIDLTRKSSHPLAVKMDIIR